MTSDSSCDGRKIIHIDMDCFFAAVEERDYPELKGLPIGIGGGDRSVLSTANYEARKYGVRSAMPVHKALKLCPKLVLRPHRFDRYREVSHQVRQIFKRYTDKIEPLSLDEAYLDVTGSSFFKGSASLIAKKIKEDIFNECELTASAGVAPNKFLAKIASDWKKPNGLFVIRPEEIGPFVQDLKVDKIFGVGAKTLEALRRWNIHTCKDLQKWSKEDLQKEFGQSNTNLYEYCRGIDNRELSLGSNRKSLSVETTFSQDLDYAGASLTLPSLYQELSERLEICQKKQELPIKTLFVKIKTTQFKIASMDQASLEFGSLKQFEDLFKQVYLRHNQEIRLLGLGVRFAELDSLRNLQESFF